MFFPEGSGHYEGVVGVNLDKPTSSAATLVACSASPGSTAQASMMHLSFSTKKAPFKAKGSILANFPAIALVGTTCKLKLAQISTEDPGVSECGDL